MNLLIKKFVRNFARPVFLIRANLLLVGIRCKHLGRKSEASPFYTAVLQYKMLTVSGLCVSRRHASPLAFSQYHEIDMAVGSFKSRASVRPSMRHRLVLLKSPQVLSGCAVNLSGRQ